MKGIVYVRVDDRMIHGQVAAYWTNFLKATRIMVVNDAAAKDEITRATLKMATPTGIALSVLEMDKAAENILSEKYGNQRVLLILKNPKDAVGLYEKGVQFEKINIGNLSGGTGKKALTNTVSCTEDELAALKTLAQKGVKIIWQMVPNNAETDLIELIQKA